MAYNAAGNSPTNDEHIGTFSNGTWILDTNFTPGFQASDSTVTLGSTGDIAVVGDWNGDGAKNIGVFRDGVWILDTNGTPGFQSDDTTVNSRESW